LATQDAVLRTIQHNGYRRPIENVWHCQREIQLHELHEHGLM
jgi:hypothetical protein